jgi:hypothetical protein
LRQARERFEKEGNDDRHAAFSALGACWSFITLFRTPVEETLHVPILRLQDALAGLDEGRTEPIVKAVRRPRGGRAPSSHAHAGMKGYAAATVQLLLQTGFALGDAHRAVATELSQLGVRPERGSGTVTATTVRNWCNEVSSDVGRRGMAALMYDDKLAPEEQERFSSLPKGQARKFALQCLATWVRSLFPEPPKAT